MSNDAPPPPPEDQPKPAAGAESVTAAFPVGAPTVTVPESPVREKPTAKVSVSEFDSEVFAGVSAPGSEEKLTAPFATGDRPQLRQSAPAVTAGPRRVRLSVSRVDPWSVMKMAFLLSVAIGIMIVVASALVWSVLDSMEVFGKIENLLTELRVGALLQLMDFLQFDSVISLATLIAVLDIVLLTALATVMALLYNIIAALVGGIHVTLTDE